MRPPLQARELRVFQSVESTQGIAKQFVSDGEEAIGGVLALEQTKGRGRLGREWLSPIGASLSVSYVLWDYSHWPAPELIGMACGLAAAVALDCQIAWPNDLMRGGRKVGGVLTELHKDSKGRTIPIVGVGANLKEFPVPFELREIVGFLNSGVSPEAVTESISKVMQVIPDPVDWLVLSPQWMPRDCTNGKCYKLPNGQVGTAIGISDNGALRVNLDGVEVTVPSAEAWFGSDE